MTQCKYVKLEYRGQNKVEGTCLECGWRSTHYGTAGLDSTAHSKETGHKVEVVKEVGYIINPFNK